MHERTLKGMYQTPQAEMDLRPIEAVLGEDMPEITPSAVGRHRLLGALRMKFGANFKNHPAAGQALRHFDSEKQYFDKLMEIKAGGAK